MKPTQKKFNAGIFFPALLCTLLWGSAFPCVKMGYQLFQISSDATFQKLVFAGWRFSLAGLLVLITARVIGRQNIIPRRGQWGGVIVMALLQTGVQYALFYIAMSHTTGTRGSVITGSAVFFSVIGAHFLFKNDKMTKLKGIGCFIGFAGVILINLNGAGTTEAGVHFMGEGLMLLSAICTGLAAPVCKRLTDNGLAPMMITGWQMLLGGFMLLALGYCGGGSLTTITPQGIGLLTYMILLSAAAFSVWSILLKKYSTSSVAVYNFLVPVFGALLSGIILGEKVVSFRNFASLVLVCAGIYFVNRGPKTASVK